jgi:hypothetical protein
MLSRPCLSLSITLLALSAGAARAQQPSPPPEAPPPSSASPAPAPPDSATPPDKGNDEPPRPRFLIGPEVGVFFPSNARTRDAFGSHFTNVGIGLGALQQRSERGAIGFDLSFVTNRNKESNLFVAPVGLLYARRLGNGGSSVVPYAGASVNLFLVNMKTTKGDYDVKAGFRSGFGTSVFAGTTIGRSVYLQARYLVATEVSGFDLSGLNVSTGLRF